jgi:hypothetical protein
LWVIVTLASLAVILVLVLSVPFEMAFQVSVPGRPRFRMKLLWLFGLVSKEIIRKKKSEEKKKVVEKEPKPKEGKRRIRVIIGILRTEGLLRKSIVLLRDLLRSLKIRDLLADFRVGLGNPADTGLLFALIGPTTSWLSSSLSLQIRVQPSFADEATFEGYSRGAVRLRPIQLVIPFLRFVFSLATVRMVKKLVLTKWKRKK